MSRRLGLSILLALAAVLPAGDAVAGDVFDRVRHGYADSDGVRIHYATLGRGPLIVMIHGFPDFWYSWRDQMAALSRRYQVVAMDLRGYNLSDRPAGVENYDLTLLVNDVAAVIRDVGRERAVVVGHDWGGAVAWTLAMRRPELVERLVILNLPHPRCLLRELRENPAQQEASAYARAFQESDTPFGTTAEAFAGLRVVPDPNVRTRYQEALGRSDLGAMLAYYKRNYPRAPYDDLPLPIVQPPVLVIHGLADPFLLAAGLDRTWQWVAQPLTIVTIPGAGHFVQWDAPALVTKTIKRWLDGDRLPPSSARIRTTSSSGRTGDDVMVGLGGNDIIDGRGGNDVICGGDGQDWLIGGAGNDRLYGNGGDDGLDGGPGIDTCNGGAHDFGNVDAASCEPSVDIP